MTITFYTNFINHHQVPLADEFYKLIGDGYTMVTFEPLPEEFRKRGYEDFSYKKYLLPAYESRERLQEAEELAISSDVVILGAAPEFLIRDRLEKNKLTFRYEERLFKKIDRRLIHLEYWKKLYKEHTRYRRKNLYMLGASAYNRLDTAMLLSYPHKCFKWGYFINVPSINITSILQEKEDQPLKILWCGTISQVKRPDLAIKLASKLKKDHIEFQLNMVGSGGGEWTSLITNLIDKLEVGRYVSLLGNLPNEEVLQMMRESHIFIFTSDRGEGWGVVLSEAMANGCTVVASNKIGAAPFLVKHKKNGMLFQSGSIKSLYKAVKFIIENNMSYNLLKGKRGIIFGALNEQSIAWKVAEKAVEEGAVITLSNTPVAVRMGEVSALAEKLNCEVIPADATCVEDLENVFKRSMEVLGGKIDFVLHSIGMSPNVRKKRTYDNLDYDMLNKTLDISAVSFHKMIQSAKKLDAINEYGSIVALSYVAAQRTFYGYNDMADAKALLESIARSFGYIYGREHNVRINTISQSPTMTTAGSGVKGMDKLFDFANRMSPLGNASADECADYCIVMFSDLTRKVTMQNLFHDGGFSSVGMSLRAMATYEKGLDEYKDENGHIIYG